MLALECNEPLCAELTPECSEIRKLQRPTCSKQDLDLWPLQQTYPDQSVAECKPQRQTAIPYQGLVEVLGRFPGIDVYVPQVGKGHLALHSTICPCLLCIAAVRISAAAQMGTRLPAGGAVVYMTSSTNSSGDSMPMSLQSSRRVDRLCR